MHFYSVLNKVCTGKQRIDCEIGQEFKYIASYNIQVLVQVDTKKSNWDAGKSLLIYLWATGLAKSVCVPFFMSFIKQPELLLTPVTEMPHYSYMREQ